MSKTLKTLLGTLLCLCLMLGVMLGLNVSASAEETKTGYGVTIDGTETFYAEYSDAVDAATAEGVESATLKLYQDTNSTEWYHAGSVTVDLNGHNVTMRLITDGCNLTVIDTAETKGTITNWSGAALNYFSGKLIIDASVDCAGEGDGHEAWTIANQGEIASVTIGSTGTEDIVLPEGLVALRNDNETT